MHCQTSAPVDRTVPLPAYLAVPQSGSGNSLGQVARALDNVLSMPWAPGTATTNPPRYTCRTSRPRGRTPASMSLVSRRNRPTWLRRSHCKASRGTIPELSGFRTGCGSARGREGGDTTESHGPKLAREPSNTSSNQYLLAPAYAYGAGYVA